MIPYVLGQWRKDPNEFVFCRFVLERHPNDQRKDGTTVGCSRKIRESVARRQQQCRENHRSDQDMQRLSWSSASWCYPASWEGWFRHGPFRSMCVCVRVSLFVRSFVHSFGGFSSCSCSGPCRSSSQGGVVGGCGVKIGEPDL